ncbi:MAG: 16S rRNA (guanine(966)-N(2))-methyltransferase RsmD [Erysipelotrichaceae bacterium]|jgi:16S rRNA (guanine966-N2)-methyltransferase|nr:16S rRNA (guanine(966)-N(2))-methyltransferase RsmD [Erysipelotrichaceae bacterium]
MRIVAGKYRSRRIETRSSSKTRPTLDKVREAVFSSLGGSFQGGSFLDLYAGSGANGFEALSRGMERAVFVDSSAEASAVIRQNAASLGCIENCDIYCMKDTKALDLLKAEGRRFKVIYLDPPYAQQHNIQILNYIDENEMMNDHGVLVIESDAKDHFTQNYRHLKYLFDKEYGMTRMTYYRYEEKL